MRRRRHTLFLLSLVFSLCGLCAPPSARATVTTVTDSTALRLALSTAAAGDTVLVVGDGIQGAVARLRSGVHLVCETPYAGSLRHLEVVDLATEAVIEGFRLTGTWPPEDSPPPMGTTDANVLVTASVVTFDACRFEYLGYLIGFYKDQIEPISGIFPILLTDSEVRFLGCRFENNGGDVLLSEAPEFGCVGQRGSGWTDFEDCSFQDQPFPIFALGPLGIAGSTFRNCGPGMIEARGGLSLRTSLIVGCGPSYYQSDDLTPAWSYARCIEANGQVQIEGNTFVDNPMMWRHWGLVYELEDPEIYVPLVTLGDGATGVVSHNLLIGLTGPALEAPATVQVSCNDAWESETALWTGGIGDLTGVDGNISQAPIFCSRVDSLYTLSEQSPAATAECGLMGAFPTACDRGTPVAVEDFQAKWTPEGVALWWELAESVVTPQGIADDKPASAGRAASGRTPLEAPGANAPAASPVVFIERLDHDGLHEIYRGEATNHLDPSPPVDGPLQYALGYEIEGQRLSGLSWTTPSGEPVLPRTRLLGASPNPFNPRTEIRFELARAGDARLEIFDSMGRRVRSWQMPALAAGPHAVRWHGIDDRENKVASGVYHLRLEVEGKIFSDRLVVLR